jgi:photosystem II stability/assembly factor-like uncharacterized protein
MKPFFSFILCLAFISIFGQTKKPKESKSPAIPVVTTMPAADTFKSDVFAGLKMRSIGPALVSGRINQIVVNPDNHSEYYVVVASGGIWKTTNSGTTFAPIFDSYGSYSMGALTMDPSNHSVLWLGTGENNNQRSVAYGDGIYKSEDAGKTWKNMGLKNSEHIGQIVVDSKNSDIVYVAAYGPLWASGGERGIYKTTDGGKNWSRILHVSDHTGFNEIHMDPRDNKVLFACAHQRQRKIFTYIGGGPETALYKSTDAGATWNKVVGGFPSGKDLGRIGLAISPAKPDYIYAIVEGDETGVYRSTDRGVSWEKRSGYQTSGNYYQELICDPINPNRVWSTNTFLMITDDGGKTWRQFGEKNKHVDNHDVWVDPSNTLHTRVGCDGGLYESWDDGQNWHFKSNLPITQFYKVAVDYAKPFYGVYGGTQDNFSLGGPSRTVSGNGVANSDWYITCGGDGFESQVDYTDDNIIYAQSQYGGLQRFDKRSGEQTDIRPIEYQNETANRWNWDAPLVISQHDPKRLYFAANKVYRTDDRGDSWKIISPDLTSGIDRNRQEVMGKVWSMDAVAKNGSTDIYGNIVSLAESKQDPDLLWVGTDDGLIHVTTNGGTSWNKLNAIPGAPSMSYINQIIVSLHDKNTAYVAINQHRMADFKPYLFKTTDLGKTWTSVSANLPQRGSVYTIAEDHVDPNLLFVGTEFGLFVSVNGAKTWTQIKNGLPTIAVRDLEIQRRENDLVLATFGRGFWILENYAALRNFDKKNLDKPAFIYPAKEAVMYNPWFPLGVRDKGFQGESHYTTPNPAPGATIVYNIKEDIKTLKEIRKAKEAEKIKKGEPVYYPSIDSMRMEDNEPEPYVLATITDENGEIVRRLKLPAKKGGNSFFWDLRSAPVSNVSIGGEGPVSVFASAEKGYPVLPGNYKVSISKFQHGVYTDLDASTMVKATPLNNTTIKAEDQNAVLAFNKDVAEIRRLSSMVQRYQGDLSNKLRFIKAAFLQAPKLPLSVNNEALALEERLRKVGILMNGDQTLSSREFETLPGINGKVFSIIGSLWDISSGPTGSMKKTFTETNTELNKVIIEVNAITEEVSKIEMQLEKAGAPYTPGRMPGIRRS